MASVYSIDLNPATPASVHDSIAHLPWIISGLVPCRSRPGSRPLWVTTDPPSFARAWMSASLRLCWKSRKCRLSKTGAKRL